MPFDTLAMAAVADDVRSTIVGARIQRIIQPSAHSVALSLYGAGQQTWLVLSADARYARVHLTTTHLAKAFATPSTFVMLLRKYLDGARVEEVVQVPGERVLRVSCGGGEFRWRLVVEVMGKHSNILLLDDSERILGAAKIVSSKQSRVRPVMPGLPYALPPARNRDDRLYSTGERIDPYLSPAEFAALYAQVPAETTVRSALLGLLPGAGPFLADEIARRSGSTGNATVQTIEPVQVAAVAAELYALYRTHAWQPAVFRGEGGRPDFAPYLPSGRSEVQRTDSISEAVERCLGGDESRDALRSLRQELLADVDRSLETARRRISSLHSGFEATENAEAVMQQGQLVLAYQYAITPRATSLDIPDMNMSIALDPQETAKGNAERLFRRYRKLRDGRQRIPHLLTQAESEAARLQDLSVFVTLATTESELRALRTEVQSSAQPVPAKRARADQKRGPARLQWGPYTLLMGRNARENEEVTFRLAGREDLWFHARERTGAHVVLLGQVDPPDKVLQSVAQITAYHSEGRTDTAVDVDVAAVRDVRKIPGGPPGRVTYRNFRTMRVRPARGDWEPASKRSPR